MLRLKEQLVRKMIAETGYSVKAWAEKNGFSQTTLSNWLNGARNIKRSSLQKLADALCCDPIAIVTVVVNDAGDEITPLEADREEICGLFGQLSQQERKAVIELVRAIANRYSDINGDSIEKK